jgi:hypothetical protein
VDRLLLLLLLLLPVDRLLLLPVDRQQAGLRRTQSLNLPQLSRQTSPKCIQMILEGRMIQ